MPWEQRGSRRYYYQPVRVDGQPRRIYWGSEDEGRLHELLTAHARRVRAKRVAAVRARAAAVAAAGKAVAELIAWARQLVRAVRLIGGEYQHHGQWRRRGQPLTSPADPLAAQDWAAEVGADEIDDPYRRLVRMNDRANERDWAARGELTGLLDAGSAVWAEYAGRVRAAVVEWADLMAGGDATARVELTRETTDWSAALAGESPTLAVRAAAGAAGVACLVVRHGEAEVSANRAGRRSKVLRRLRVAVNRLREAVDLVVAAQAAAAPVARSRPRVPPPRQAPVRRAGVA